MNRKLLSVLALILLAPLCERARSNDDASSAGLPIPSPEKLPRWRGFNLLEKFNSGHCGPFKEEDFQLIHELGFNFVRLPMDYRGWIEDKDWNRLRESSLREIDQAVEWGGKYQIHVCINFHRAPGYTVAHPSESQSLWTDAEAQRICAMHWAAFARRYKGVPSARLSFNLFNEPGGVKPDVYAAVVRHMVEVIRREDPHRLIISDGIQWGSQPVVELRDLKIAQATRGYAPVELTHYKASWMSGSDRFPMPTWPVRIAYGMLYGPNKRELSAPLVIDGPLGGAARLRLHVGSVSDRCRLVVEADGKPVFTKQFVCGPGKGEWKQTLYKPEWRIYQNLFDRDYVAEIPAGVRQIRVRRAEGDWLTLGELGLKAETDRVERVLVLSQTWGKKPPHLTCPPDAADGFGGTELHDGAWLRQTVVRPWKEAESLGIGVIVGEFGEFNRTPHPVVLAWMEDCLKNWQAAGWGWDLWNFRGPFGVLDSERADVKYEPFHGHKLDRKMLDLLQRY